MPASSGRKHQEDELACASEAGHGIALDEGIGEEAGQESKNTPIAVVQLELAVIVDQDANTAFEELDNSVGIVLRAAGWSVASKSRLSCESHLHGIALGQLGVPWSMVVHFQTNSQMVAAYEHALTEPGHTAEEQVELLAWKTTDPKLANHFDGMKPS